MKTIMRKNSYSILPEKHYKFLLIAIAILFPILQSVLMGQNMAIGTNFWAHVEWTGEKPFKSNVNFQAAWDSGTTDYLVNENVWNEDFLEEVDFYQVLRFMDWLPTNKSPITSWSQRRRPGEQDQSAKFGAEVGVAFEWMIDLCNRVDADLWVCLPHAADDDYHTQLATLIFNRLKPGLKVYVEYSNEVWNFDVQKDHATREGARIGITTQEYVALRSAQMWRHFADVFGDQFEDRVVKTICGQAANSWIANEQLAYLYSDRNQTGLHPDVYGIAPYFGGNGLSGNDSNIWNLLETDLFTHRWDRADKASRMEGVRANYNRIKGFDENLKLVAYEGGQHIKQHANRVNFHPNMYDLYIKYLEALDDYLSVFAHYVNAGQCSADNCWGAKEFTGQSMDDAPKYRPLNLLHKTTIMQRRKFIKNTSLGFASLSVPFHQIKISANERPSMFVGTPVLPEYLYEKGIPETLDAMRELAGINTVMTFSHDHVFRQYRAGFTPKTDHEGNDRDVFLDQVDQGYPAGCTAYVVFDDNGVKTNPFGQHGRLQIIDGPPKDIRR